MKLMELSKEEMEEQLKLLNQLKDNITEYESLQKQLQSIRNSGVCWQNTDTYFWQKITEKYERNTLLNCFGDIFYIIDKKTKMRDYNEYVGQRVLWNLGLSKEKYKITEEIIRDDDGDIDCIIHDINVLQDDNESKA